MRIGIILGPIVFVLWLFCVIDVIMSRDEECKHLPKLAWLLIVFFFPLAGSLAWLLIGRNRSGAPWQRGRAASSSSPYPEYDRPGRATTADPAADEEFLRQCRERAEEQRLRYRAQREREDRAREEQEREDRAREE